MDQVIVLFMLYSCKQKRARNVVLKDQNFRGK